MANTNIHERLTTLRIDASAPCRIDMGGTLDISTMALPLRRFRPCTFNIAMDLRTRVSLRPHRDGYVRITSRGFEPAEYTVDALPYDHALGLMFAVAAYFNVGGIHIDITSTSPPRSALGGSSAAAVALVAALTVLTDPAADPKTLNPDDIVRIAHAIESSVAGVPCGMQDQLAAAYGGMNAWYWGDASTTAAYQRIPIGDTQNARAEFQKHVLAAYCGTPHESRDINGRWIRQFLAGENRPQWIEIIDCASRFVKAIQRRRFDDAARAMNRETDIRVELTPDVFDSTGSRLNRAARDAGCGARFTGAGGGGCIWAIGAIADIRLLKDRWEAIVGDHASAHLLEAAIDPDGVRVEIAPLS